MRTTRIVGGFFILLLCILLFFLLSPVSIFPNIGRDYAIDDAKVTATVMDDGRILVEEDITYTFKGCFHEVFRNIPIAREPGADYPYLLEISAACEPGCEAEDRSYEIAGMFGQICDRKAHFFVNYTVLNGLVRGDDVVELHFKLWGDEWAKSAKHISGEIRIPDAATSKTDIYFNPYKRVAFTAEGPIITYDGAPWNYAETRLLLPPEAFAGAAAINSPGLTRADVRAVQASYMRRARIAGIIVPALIVLFAIIIVVVPWQIYKRQGREPKIAYDSVYEREPIEGTKPYMINSLCIGLGRTNGDAVTATLMDLIRRKHISVQEIMTTTKGIFSDGTKKDLQLTFVQNPHDPLTEPEKIVYDYFKGFAKDEKLAWSSLLKELKDRSNGQKYLSMTSKFDESVRKSYVLKDYYSAHGNVLFKSFCAAILIAGIALRFFGGNISYNYPAVQPISWLGVVLIICAVACFFVPSTVFGQFTAKGLETYRRSMNFKKFMTDMTALKQRPPTSVILWEQYLVYATAFGVAEEVIKQLHIVVPDSKVSKSPMAPLYAATAISSLGSAHSTAVASTSRSSGGSGFHGGGSVGGGFGGGGGGAR